MRRTMLLTCLVIELWMPKSLFLNRMGGLATVLMNYLMTAFDDCTGGQRYECVEFVRSEFTVSSNGSAAGGLDFLQFTVIDVLNG